VVFGFADFDAPTPATSHLLLIDLIEAQLVLEPLS